MSTSIFIGDPLNGQLTLRTHDLWAEYMVSESPSATLTYQLANP